MTAIDLTGLELPKNITARLVNELWENPSKAQKLAIIQDEDAKCTLKAYRKTIDFMQEKMSGFDHEEIFHALQQKGWKAAFSQARAIFKQKRNKQIPATVRHRLYQALAHFLKQEFYAYIGYDRRPLSTSAFFALQEAGEARLAQQLNLNSADAAGNLVFLSLDRLKVKELLEITPQMKQWGFIPTLLHIKSLTKARKYESNVS